MKRLLAILAISFLLFGSSAGAADVTLDKGEQFKFVWDANQEPDLAGYRIYMRTASGSYTYGAGNEYASVGVMAEPMSGPHAISTVGTYFFVVTAFDDAGMESDPSNEVSAMIENMPPKPPGGCAILKF